MQNLKSNTLHNIEISKDSLDHYIIMHIMMKHNSRETLKS